MSYVRQVLFFVLTLGNALANAQANDTPRPEEFAWRGTLELPAQASLVRVQVPLEALLRMQSSTAQDLRVFNAAGAVVPFTILANTDLNQPAPAVHTAPYPAYALFGATSGRQTLPGAVEVRMDSGAGSAWVHWSSPQTGVAPGDGEPTPLQAALFDTRAEKHAVEALQLELELPHNVLVPIAVASSTNLQDWNPVATKGPLFQFDGNGAPVNTTLELSHPLHLEGRYLRLSWNGQTGVKLHSLTGRLVSTHTTPQRLRAILPQGNAEGANALSWTLPFATPIAALHLEAVYDNTLTPLHIQGRTAQTQPWRTLASSVVYRLDNVAQGSSNPPTPLHGVSLRGLRIVTAHNSVLPEGGLRATIEFAPLHVVFLASGAGPYTLTVGRVKTPAMTLDTSLLRAVVPKKLAELPLAYVSRHQVLTDDIFSTTSTGWWPAGLAPRTVLLWFVLGAGVLVLAAVAISLLSTLQNKQGK
ncbi:MAG: DUF3999 family protein [Rhodoferax sp.]|nr:DUF3999 family protein [Rhodoferax sp.]